MYCSLACTQPIALGATINFGDELEGEVTELYEFRTTSHVCLPLAHFKRNLKIKQKKIINLKTSSIKSLDIISCEFCIGVVGGLSCVKWKPLAESITGASCLASFSLLCSVVCVIIIKVTVVPIMRTRERHLCFFYWLHKISFRIAPPTEICYLYPQVTFKWTSPHV